MKRIKLVFISCCCLLFLTSCMERIEINNLGLVSGLGIDLDLEKQEYTVTVQLLNPSGIGGDNPNSMSSYVYKATGNSIDEAITDLDTKTSSALFFSHLSAVVLSERFAEYDMKPFINFALRTAEIRPDISIVIAKEETPFDILSVVTAKDTINAKAMDISNFLFSRTAYLTHYDLYETAKILNSPTIDLVLNSVHVFEEEEPLQELAKKHDKDPNEFFTRGNTVENRRNSINPVQLVHKYQAVFKGQKLVGYMDPYETQLYNILMNKSKRYSIPVWMTKEMYTSYSIIANEAQIKPDIKNNKVDIELKLSAHILENQFNVDTSKLDNLALMGEKLKEKLNKDYGAFMANIQKNLKSDILGIAAAVKDEDPVLWREISGFWEEIYPQLQINVTIDVSMMNVGEIRNVSQ